MMLIQLYDNQIEWLLKAKKTKQRSFSNWELTGLINEAIFEFYQKYKEEE